MTLIADILLIAGAAGAAFYCLVLSRRLSRFTDLERGVGGAVAMLSVQVDDMTKMLQKAQTSASQSAQRLEELSERADNAARQLELMLASMHDLPVEAPLPKPEAAPAEPAQIFSTRRTPIREKAA